MKILLFMLIVFLLLSCSLIELADAKKGSKPKKSKQKQDKKPRKAKSAKLDKRAKKVQKSQPKLNIFDAMPKNPMTDIVFSGLQNVNLTNTELRAGDAHQLEYVHSQLKAVFGAEHMQTNARYARLPTGYSVIDETLGAAYLLSAHQRYTESDVVFRSLLSIRNDIYSAIYGLSDTYRARSDMDTASLFANMYVSMDSASPIGYYLLAKVSDEKGASRSEILQLFDQAYSRLNATSDLRLKSDIVLLRGQHLANLNYRDLALVNFDEFFRWNVLEPREALAVSHHVQYVDQLQQVPVSFFRVYVEVLMAVGDVEKATAIVDIVLGVEADKTLYLNEQQKRAAEDQGISLSKHMYMAKISSLVTEMGQWQEGIEALEELRALLLEDLDEVLLQRVVRGSAYPTRDFSALSARRRGLTDSRDMDSFYDKKYTIYAELLRYYAEVEFHIGRLDSALVLYAQAFDIVTQYIMVGVKLGKPQTDLKSSKEQVHRLSTRIASCLTALGRFGEAVSVYEDVILESLPADPAGYARDRAVAWWTRLDTPFNDFSPDRIVAKESKSGAVTGVAYSPPGADTEFDRYFGAADDSYLVRPDDTDDCVIYRIGFDDLAELAAKWSDENGGGAGLPIGVALDLRRANVLELVTSTIGGWIQLKVLGFYPNTRSFRSFGLGVLHIAQKLRAHTIIVHKYRQASEAAGCGGVESESCDAIEESVPRGLYVSDAMSSRSNYSEGIWSSGTGHDHQHIDHASRTHLLEYRDVVDLAVRYRQLVDPQTSIYWVDNMPPDALLEFNPTCGGGSYSLATPLLTGEKKSTRYFPNFDLAFNLSRDEMLSGGGFYMLGDTGIIHDSVDQAQAPQAADVSTLHDLYLLAGQRSHWVMTPCTSRIRGLQLVGSRLVVTRQSPRGAEGGQLYTYELKTPTTWKRMHAYEQQLQQSFTELVELLSDPAGSDPSAVLRMALELFYYWVNFAPLTRGTASVGYSLLMAALLAHGQLITSRIPEGRQLDWEAILYRDPDTFIARQLEWITLEELRDDSSGGDAIDDLAKLGQGSLLRLLDSADYALDGLLVTPRDVIASLHGGVSVGSGGIAEVLGVEPATIGLSEEVYPDIYEL